MDDWEEDGWELLDYEAADGGEVLTLARRGDVHAIRVDNRMLMSSRVHGSEQTMVRYGCRHLAKVEGARVLVGGLGLGYTLSATLGFLRSPSATVVVAEQSAAVVRWNRGLLGPLAGNPLDDPRVDLRCGDVADVIRDTTEPFGAILLDVDNGPGDLTLAENHSLYSRASIDTALAALDPEGVLVIWSAAPDYPFQILLRSHGRNFRTHPIGDRGGKLAGKRRDAHFLHIIRHPE